MIIFFFGFGNLFYITKQANRSLYMILGDRKNVEKKKKSPKKKRRKKKEKKTKKNKKKTGKTKKKATKNWKKFGNSENFNLRIKSKKIRNSSISTV